MSDRLRCSSTKYGPSVSEGVTTHAGVRTVFALDDGVGELREAEGVRPVQAATKAAKPTRRAVRRVTTASRRFTTPW
jgi:hypothetical protein